MCPVSTALPPQRIVTEDTHIFAIHDIAAVPGTASVYQLNLKVRNETAPAGDAAALYGGVGGVGSATVCAADSSGAPGNVFCTLVTTTVNAIGGGFLPAFHRPAYGPASEWAAGALTAPSDVVGAYNVTWALTTAAAAWPIDTTGFCFIPAGSFFDGALRTGATPLSGFGMFFNDDGAGNAVVELVAWDQATTTHRTRVSTALVPDVLKWNSSRFVIVGAKSGREASLTFSCNGTDVATLVFGSAELVRPWTRSANALQYVFGIAQKLGGGEGYFYHKSGYDGRFLPDGTELQAFGA